VTVSRNHSYTDWETRGGVNPHTVMVQGGGSGVLGAGYWVLVLGTGYSVLGATST